jgi:hypothetical protein
MNKEGSTKKSNEYEKSIEMRIEINAIKTHKA